MSDNSVICLAETIEFLNDSVAVNDKILIEKTYAPALQLTQGISRIGDDCAAIPDAGGYLLLAAEGLQESFVADDPWFAGYSAIMVNVSDVCAMGGRPLAVIDVIWSSQHEETDLVWQGMQAAATAYGVPLVGGHTTITHRKSPVYLAAAILGRASALMTSFDAKPGDELVMVVDLNGSYQKGNPFWNSSVGTQPKKLQEQNELLPQLAASGWCSAAKDISNGGVVGTLIMMLACSSVGATLDLSLLPKPPKVNLEKWLITFPSFGYLFSVPPRHGKSLIEHFTKCDLVAAVIGEVTTAVELKLCLDGEAEVFWKPRTG